MKTSSLLAKIILTLLIFASTGKSLAQNYRFEPKELFNLTELNIGYGLQGDVEPNEIGFSGLSTLIGYTLSHYWTTGLGVGIFAYNGSNCVPLYAEGAYRFNSFGLGKMRFFIKGDGGILIRLNGDVSPTRFYGNPAVGMLVPIARHKEISISLGWFAQWDPNNTDETKQGQLTDFINAKVGLRIY